MRICRAGAAIANAVYNATDVRVRHYPITLGKHLERLPGVVDDLPAKRDPQYDVQPALHASQL